MNYQDMVTIATLFFLFLIVSRLWHIMNEQEHFAQLAFCLIGMILLAVIGLAESIVMINAHQDKSLPEALAGVACIWCGYAIAFALTGFKT